MRTFTCSGFMFSAPATMPCASCWNWVGPTSNTESARTSAMKFIGSIVACAVYGVMYSDTTVLAAVFSAASASPTFLKFALPGLSTAALSSFAMPVDDMPASGPASQRISTAASAILACQ